MTASRHKGPRDRGRYSKVSRRMWNDERVQRLSWPPPNGLTLWQRLLTGTELGVIPGAFQAWEAGLAQALRWDLKGFREAFDEVLTEGLARADWSVGFVWVPKAIEHNKPESPNVVRSWRDSWEELPDCQLKLEAYEGLKAFVEALGEGFAQAFVEACRKPSSKTCANQEQEQEQDNPLVSPPRSNAPKASRKGARRKAKVPLPEGWSPNDAHRAKAVKLKLDLSAQVELFRNNAEGKDVRWVDWDKAFHNWLSSPYATAPRAAGTGGAFGGTPAEREQAERDARLLAEIRDGAWGEHPQARALDTANPIDLRLFREAIKAGKVKRVQREPASAVHATRGQSSAAGAVADVLANIGRPAS